MEGGNESGRKRDKPGDTGGWPGLAWLGQRIQAGE